MIYKNDDNENNYYEQLDIIKNTNRPVIVWGTLELGKMAKRVCEMVNQSVVCFGDNDLNKNKQLFWNLPILSGQQIAQKYPDAIIIVCSYNIQTVEKIIKQLSEISSHFSFLYPNFIKYMFKMKVLSGKKDSSFVMKIINFATIDYSRIPIKKVNKSILSYYRIRATDDTYILKILDVLNSVGGVKELEIIVDSSHIKNNFVSSIKLLANESKIFTISILTNAEYIPDKNIMLELKEYLFKIKLLDSKDKKTSEFLQMLDKMEFITDCVESNETIPPHCEIKDQKKILNKSILQQIIFDYVSKSAECQKEKADSDKNEELVLCYVGAGLGCQILTYLFAKMLADRTNKKVILDDTSNYIRNGSPLGVKFFIKELKNTYSLNNDEAQKCAQKAYETISHFQFEGLELAKVFDLSLDLLSSYFSNSVWKEYINKRSQEDNPLLTEFMEKKGCDMSVFVENDAIKEPLTVHQLIKVSRDQIDWSYSRNDVTDFLLNTNLENKYYYITGSSLSTGDWLLKKRKWVQSQLHFSSINDSYNLSLLNKIAESDAVIIHVRRGELVFTGVWSSTEYYRKSIIAIQKLDNYINKKYFVFSDSVDWCKNNKEKLGLDIIEQNLTYVNGNTGANSYRDLQLMSKGKILVVAPTSTFSFCALLLGNIEKYVDGHTYMDKCQAGYNEKDLDVEILDIID